MPARLLAIRRRDNADWEAPRGILERDETIAEGLVREVDEETGLSVEAEAVTGVYRNMPRGVVALMFAVGRSTSRSRRPPRRRRSAGSSQRDRDPHGRGAHGPHS